MWRRSPTFRQQCRRISEAENLRIEVVFVPQLPLTPLRALSTVKKHESGTIVVKMKLRAPGNYVEVIAHEFEHVLEQLEGLNLQAIAAQKESNVYRNEVGAYETARAVEAGLRVPDEYRRGDDREARAQTQHSVESSQGCD